MAFLPRRAHASQHPCLATGPLREEHHADNCPTAVQQTIAAQSVAARLASVGLADLEEAFWVCDYTAATRGTAGSDISVCTAVYEAVKERKFEGDFDKLLDWWRQNKAARHDALAAADAVREPR
ncbi:MAG: hypothetical protein HYU75_02620 [Betaproteobacteria bacterium]|nr:hypothetical protein [Betaproteobacteria bacterium]